MADKFTDDHNKQKQQAKRVAQRKQALAEFATFHKVGQDTHEPVSALKEITHAGEVSTSMLHSLHIAMIGGLHTLEAILPPLRLALVGITSIWEALNAVYYSKKSDAHRTAQVVIAVISTLSVVLSLIIPHAALTMLVTYAAVELFREFTHFFEAFKDYWKLRKVKRAINQEQLNHIRHFLMEKSVDIGFGLVAVVGATLAIFSTAILFATPLPVIGLGLMVASGVGAVLFKAGLATYQWINRKLKARRLRAEQSEGSQGLPSSEESAVSSQLTPPSPGRRARRSLGQTATHYDTPPKLVHESTVDIYRTMDLLKEEANQQAQLQQAGWVKQPLMTNKQRQERVEFWRAHRFAPSHASDETLQYDDEDDNDSEREDFGLHQ